MPGADGGCVLNEARASGVRPRERTGLAALETACGGWSLMRARAQSALVGGCERGGVGPQRSIFACVPSGDGAQRRVPGVLAGHRTCTPPQGADGGTAWGKRQKASKLKAVLGPKMLNPHKLHRSAFHDNGR